MIGFGRSYVDVGSCDVFFLDKGTVRIRSGLYRARQGLDLGCGGPGKKTNSRGQKYPSEIRLGGAPEQGSLGPAVAERCDVNISTLVNDGRRL